MHVKQRTWGSIVIAVALGMLLLAGTAAASPSVSFTPEISSGLSGGPGSINAALEIEGTEYGGFPPPVLGIALGLPAGTTISPTGHPTCPKAVLEQIGPSGCPEGSAAGPVGQALFIVSFGAERVEESGLTETFFAPGGGVNLFIDGHSPVSLEILAHGTVAGNVITMEVPLVSTVPGAPYASLKDLWLRFGETEEEEELSHFTSGLVLPLECPTGTLSWTAAVTFDEGGANPPHPHVTEWAAKTGCPLGQEPSRGKRAAEASARKHAEEETAAKKRAEEQAAIAKRRDEEAELVTLRALVQRLERELHAAVKVGKVKLSRRGLLLTIKTYEPGALTIKGPGLKSIDRTLPPGTHPIMVLLTKAGEADRRAGRRIKVSVSEKVGARMVVAAQEVRL